jgi:SAM-dependent methyltransferase
MADKGITPPHYEFSEKYDPDHARKYFHKHNTGFWRRLSTWREVGMARKALVMAGRPRSVLDLPCGTGRFWSMLAEEPGRKIYVADNSRAMIEAGLELRPRDVVARIEKSFCLSAFDTGLPNNFVESVFSIRFLHHIQKSEDRVAILREFSRISSGTVIVSLWVDGNYRAWRQLRKQARKAQARGSAMPRDRIILKTSEIEGEFADANLELIGHVDFIKYWDKWRTYVLHVKKPGNP